MKKSEKGGTRPTHRASARYGTSVAVLSMEKWDAGQAVVLPHSLKMVARAKLTLPRHSQSSMVDWPTAGATDGGTQDGGMGFLPLSFFVGAMAMGRRGRFKIELETVTRVQSEEGQRALEQPNRGTAVYDYGSAQHGAK